MKNIILFISILTLALAIFPPPKQNNLRFESKVQLNGQICQLRVRVRQPGIRDDVLKTRELPFNHHSYLSKLRESFKLTHSKCKNFVPSQITEFGIGQIILNYGNYKKQAYSITVSQGQIQLAFGSYEGYVYALETLYQMIDEDLRIPTGFVYDQPLVQHRGIMIDSARHFIQVQTILRLIKTMPSVKLNILHWHITDDQAFSFDSGSHPQVTKYGALDRYMVYSTDDIQVIMKAAKQNAVQVIPEINTQSGARSWALSPEWKNKSVTVKCDPTNNYLEQFDVSKKQTLALVQSIVKQVDFAFVDSPYLHLGGLGVTQKCWNTSAIRTYKTLHNLKTFSDLVNFWRFQVKQALAPVRKVIHWQTQKLKLQTGPDDVIQYFGAQNHTSQALQKSKGKVILSPWDVLSLGSGFGGAYGQHDEFDKYNVWRHDIISSFQLFPEGVDKTRILGAQVVVQGHNTNNDQLQNNVWMRAAAFAMRVWSDQVLPFDSLLSELVSLQAKFVSMGLDVSPLTVEICEKTPKGCITSKKEF